jgi:hypothetical protein
VVVFAAVGVGVADRAPHRQMELRVKLANRRIEIQPDASRASELQASLGAADAKVAHAAGAEGSSGRRHSSSSPMVA